MAHKPKILIVEDNAMASEVLRSFLEELNHSIVGLATDGEKGLEMALSLRPHLVLLDIYLPKMNGLDVLQHIKQALPATVVVMISGSDDRQAVGTASELGASGHVAKPFKLDTLQAMLDQIMPQLRLP